MISDKDGNEMSCIICPISDYGYAYCDMNCKECEHFISYKRTHLENERGNKNE